MRRTRNQIVFLVNDVRSAKGEPFVIKVDQRHVSCGLK